MQKFISNWRYYGLKKDEYKKCMEQLYPKNILDIYKINTVVTILTLFFIIFPVFTEKNYIKAGFYLLATVIALFLVIFSNYKYKQLKNNKQLNTSLITTLLYLYYINIMFFGIYLAVWADPNKIAGSFVGFLICALFPFTIPAVMYLCLTIGVMAIYIVFVLLIKNPAVWNYDIQNAIFSAFIGMYFGWRFIKRRMSTAVTTSILEAENTLDELTQLKNRRDFMKTFERFLSRNRPTDNYLCIAIMDIDCFKNYNDFYGHPKGDECLRIIGKTLNGLKKSMGIYAARVGGEEFALLWHKEDNSNIKETGDKINQLIRDLRIPHEKSIVIPYITVSIGIHIAKCGTNNIIKEIYSFADKALYEAKRNGRNCTVIK